jgi:hypothetical protein
MCTAVHLRHLRYQVRRDGNATIRRLLLLLQPTLAATKRPLETDGSTFVDNGEFEANADGWNELMTAASAEPSPVIAV